MLMTGDWKMLIRIFLRSSVPVQNLNCAVAYIRSVQLFRRGLRWLWEVIRITRMWLRLLILLVMNVLLPECM